MSRRVDLRSIATYYWSTRALASGTDTATGEHVAFAMSMSQAAALRSRLDAGEVIAVDVPDTDVLFVRPRTESDRPGDAGPAETW